MVVGMAMKAIQLFSIPVSDPERAKAFYVDTLGWELVRDDAMADDLEADQATLRGHGVRVDAAIEETSWGRWVTFDDPDGNGFVLQATSARRETAAATAGGEGDSDLQEAFD